MGYKSKLYYLIAGFFIGFLLSLTGMIIETILQNPSQISLNAYHFYIPGFVGILNSILAYAYGVGREKDITEQQKTEQRLILNEYKFRTLFENMNDIVCILDINKNIIDVNKAALDFYEYSKDELLNLSIEQLVYNEDIDISNTFFEKLQDEGAYHMYEGRIITKSGKIKWIQVNSTEIVHNGEKIGSQDIIRDITKRKNIEIELLETVIKLNDLIATRDKLFSIIAHDLRSPFNSILGFSELLIDKGNNFKIADYSGYFDLINKAAKSTIILLENLLYWAKSQNGTLNLNPERIVVSSLIKDTFGLANPSAITKGVSLIHNQSDEIEIFTDKDMLMVVLRNLISNAIKFTEAGGKIQISAIPKQNHVEITISDDGVGMNKQTCNKLFNISTNITSRGTANEKGSGLGLVLCKEFVEKLGGTISVISEEGKGSDFRFTLPLHKEE